jgi:glycine/D-amino acid oxidase-like deaminating enzyme/nitrite reductase/ring-hydroxylating ferredoxin subunit
MSRPAWFHDDARRPYPALRGNLEVDVCVVGGGITGLTAAYLLKQEGRRVAVVEKSQCGDSETGHTTAHLTYVTDKRLADIASQFGQDAARAAWEAGEAAIAKIEEHVQSENIDCDFHRVPNYLHAPWQNHGQSDVRQLRKEADVAAELGFDPTWLDVTPLANVPGIRFANQGLFHPIKYLAGLARAVHSGGSLVFEQTKVDTIEEQPTTVVCGEHRIRCEQVVIATHVPIQGRSGTLPAGLLQSRLYPYNTYAIAARLPKDTIEPASWYDTSDPYYYLRIEDRDGFQTAIFGGEDHKTGQCDDTSQPYHRLVAKLREILPQAVVTDRWSGQVWESNDGLPLIGETAPGQFIATGFAGNGMTFGTVAGMMIRDAIVGRENPWRDLFEPGRVHLRGGTWRYLVENTDYPKYFAKDRLRPAQGDSLADVPAGGGRILKLHGEKVAAYRDPHGEVTCISPYCTHMGCLVHWNRAERTWDCPCHGSRFGTDGHIIAGPAETPLEERTPSAASNAKPQSK